MPKKFLSRGQQAFEALIEEDLSTSDEPIRKSRSSSSKKGKGRGELRLPGFQLRSDTTAPPHCSSSSSSSPLSSLQQAFNTLPPDVVTDVYRACNSSVAAATDALLSMHITSPEDEEQQQQQSQFSPSPQSTTTTTTTTTTNSPSLWDMLPEEIKQLIFMSLGSLESVAKAAPVCKEFAAHARLIYSLKHTLTLPKKKLSPTALAGMVSAFSNASVVNASPLASLYCRFSSDFEELIGAIAVGEAARKKNNTSSSSSSARVHVLNMSKCEALEDGDLFMICSLLKHLTGLDLSGCIKLTDVSLKTLSQYSRHEEEEEEEMSSGNSGNHTAAAAAAAAQSTTNNKNSNNKKNTARNTAAFEMPRAAVGTLLNTLIKERIDRFIRNDQDGGDYQAYMYDTASTTSSSNNNTRGLMYLNLKHCSGIKDKGLDYILKSSSHGNSSVSSKSLQHLDISHCPKVLDTMLELHHHNFKSSSVLKTLNAQSCSQLIGVHIDLPSSASAAGTNGSSSSSSMVQLQNLYLQNCSNLVEVSIICHSLETLNVSGCKKLTFMALDCRNLTTFIASNCRYLTLRSPAPPGVAAAGGDWVNGTVESIRCPALRHLNLFGSRELDSETLDSILPRLTKLQYLNAAGCVRLSRLLMGQCHQLEEMDVSGCHTLARVLVASPVMRRFRAKGCVRMHEVRFQGGVLPEWEMDVENCEVLREVVVTREVGSGVGEEGEGGEGGKGGSERRRRVNVVGCRNLSERSKELLLEKGEVKRV